MESCGRASGRATWRPSSTSPPARSEERRVGKEHRLLPGANVELQLDGENRSTKLRGRVIRCSVVRVRPEAVSYRGAIAFDCHLPWFDDGDGYEGPNIEKRSGTHFRAPDTRGVV